MRDRKPTREWKAWAEAGLLLSISLAVTLLYALTDGNPLFWDEYYHLIAGRSWAETGTLAVGDGVYTRGAWFSILVGWLIRTFGESLFIARLPGVLALSFWALAVFLWVRAVDGRTAAWISALALAMSPVVLINSVMVRFYGIVGLLLWLACVGAFLAIEPRQPLTRRIPAALASLVLLVLCSGLTPPAKVGIACLGVWLVGLALVEGSASRHRLKIFGGVALLLVLAGVWAVGSHWLPDLWTAYRSIPGWAVERGDDIRWYENLMRVDYPTLWTLLPLAAILAVPRRPKIGTLSAVMFGMGLLLLSMGGAKAERYVIPLMPFFFLLWGVAVAELIPGLRSRIASFLSLRPIRPLPPQVARVAGHFLLAVVFAFVLLTNPGFTRLRHVLRDEATSMDRVPQGRGASPKAWEELAQTLRPVIDEVEVVVTANPVQMLYHIGDYDVAMRPAVIPEVRPREEFGVDARTGRPAISAVESLARVVAAHPHGLVFGERWRWRHPVEGFTDEVTAYIESTMQRVPLDEELGVIAYRW